MPDKTFKNLAFLWLDSKKRSVKLSTSAAYALIIQNHLLPIFSDITDVDNDSVQKMVDENSMSGMSRKTIQDILTVLKMILRFAAAKGYINAVVLDVSIPNGKTASKLDIFKPEEQACILKYALSEFSFRNLGLAISVTTGMRIGEICALKWEDVNLKDGVFKVNKTISRVYLNEDGKKYTRLVISSPKSKSSEREIPISSCLKETLHHLKKLEKDEYFVLTGGLLPTEPTSYRSYYNKVLKKLNLPKIKFHALRHSFATRCIESKCDYKTVSAIMGHSSIKTTMDIYVHPDHHQKKICIDKVTRILKI